MRSFGGLPSSKDRGIWFSIRTSSRIDINFLYSGQSSWLRVKQN
jgi:hypothetical protein